MNITLTEFVANAKMTCGSSFYGRNDGTAPHTVYFKAARSMLRRRLEKDLERFDYSRDYYFSQEDLDKLAEIYADTAKLIHEKMKKFDNECDKIQKLAVIKSKQKREMTDDW